MVYELDRWSQYLKADFTLKDYLFGVVKLTKNANPDKYSYSRYGIEFDSRSLFSIPNFEWSKTVAIFEVKNSSSPHIQIRKKHILIPGKVPT